MRKKQAMAVIALGAFAVVSMLMPCPTDAKMTEDQAVKEMKARVEKFSNDMDRLTDDNQKCLKGGLKPGEKLADFRKRCIKPGEDRYEAEVEDFSNDIKKLLKEVDDKKVEKKIRDELKDLRKCDKICEKCIKKCNTDEACISQCWENADKCDTVQAKDMSKILKAIE